MKPACLFLFLLAIFTSANAETFTNCIGVNVSTTLYNLCDFAQISPYSITSNFTTEVVHLTLGNNHLPNCDNTTDIWATVTDNTTLPCENVATVGPDYSFINADNPSEGLKMTFPMHNNSNGTIGKAYKLVVNLICSEDVTDASKVTFLRDHDLGLDDPVTIELTAFSKAGCPTFSWDTIVAIVTVSQDVLASILFVLGLILCFFGYSVLKLTIFSVSALATALVIITISYQFLDLSIEEWMIWAVLGVSVVAGIIVGILAVKYKKVGYGILGGACGDIGAIMLYNSVLQAILPAEQANYVFYGLLMVAGAIGSSLAVFLIKPVVIICSSVVGAFTAVKCAAFLISGYALKDLNFVLDGVKDFDYVIYLYLLAMVGLGVWGMYFQFSNKKKKEELEREERDQRRVLKDIGDLRY